MNQLSGYKKGDKVKVRTFVTYSGTPLDGEAFETWEQGEVIAEGKTELNAFGDKYQERIIVKVGNKKYIRPAAQLR